MGGGSDDSSETGGPLNLLQFGLILEDDAEVILIEKVEEFCEFPGIREGKRSFIIPEVQLLLSVHETQVIQFDLFEIHEFALTEASGDPSGP